MLHNVKPPPRCRTALILTDDDALVVLCGISLLERLLRILQRLGFTHAHLLGASDPVAQHVRQPSWARAEISVLIAPPGFTPHERRYLFLSGSCCYDARLLQALAAQSDTAVLIDSSAAPDRRFGLAALVEEAWRSGRALDASLFDELARAARAGEVLLVDVEAQPRYLVHLRREFRPFWFPAPTAAETPAAETRLLDAAQNGTLDLPAMAHAPLETFLVRRLCKTSITPLQITFFTAAVSGVVAVLFARGQLLAGTALALLVGVLDGVDGKQARVKVETTVLGQREHLLDYVLELAWWAALAFHFTATRQLPHAFLLWLLLVGADLLDRVAKKKAKELTGRNLDDVAPVDRFVRLVGGRRNTYIWMLAAGLALGVADQAFVALCWWGALTATVHVLRVWWLTHRRRRST